MQALHNELLPPSGVEFAVSLKLASSTLLRQNSGSGASNGNELQGPRYLCNLVVARRNLLQIFEVREVAELPSQQALSNGRTRQDTDAVEGEVEMDTQGEGFVNIGAVKFTSHLQGPHTKARLFFLRQHSLHGIVTGLESIKVMSAIGDDLDRLLISFRDAKVALMEWSHELHDLSSVSIHTYERAPQMLAADLSPYTSFLRAEPASRCAALSLPQDAIAVLPFYQSQVELELMDDGAREIPYSPSFILDLASNVDDKIRNVVDFVFLPGFNNPTVAVLYQITQTWAGRLKEFKDTMCLCIFTLDLVTRRYPIITAVDKLPHDCFSLVPCASSLGGVIIMSDNAIIYVDQSSRRVALPVNGWASRITDMPLQPLTASEESRTLLLEGSEATFVDDRTLLVIMKEGTIYPVEIVMSGKIVSKLSMGPALAQTTIPSTVTNVQEGHVFIGSTVAPSVLMKASRMEEPVADDQKKDVPAAVVDPLAMDFDDDDFYGGGKGTLQTGGLGAMNGVASLETRSVLHLSFSDSLFAYGPIADMTFSLTRNGERPAAELVAATGFDSTGGFTLFQRDLPTQTKRKLHAVGGTRGIWSLPVRQPPKANGLFSERAHKHVLADYDTVIVSADSNPSPGLSRIATRSTHSDISIAHRLPNATIGAAPFFQRTAILHVMVDTIRVLEPDGNERQLIKDVDGNLRRPKIRYCCISDPFVMILREDDTLGLFVGDAERGKIRRKDMTPMGEKISRYAAGCFFSDQLGLFKIHTTPTPEEQQQQPTNGVPVTSSLEAAVDSQRGTQWLILCRPQGIMEIWTLPKLNLVYSTSLVASLQNVLVDSYDGPALSLPEETPRSPQEFDVEQILIAPIGESIPRPHLMVYLRGGELVIYELVISEPSPKPESSTRSSTLLLQFAKVLTTALETKSVEETERNTIPDHKRASRALIPFATSPTPESTLRGVFVTGHHPLWILATDKSATRTYSCAHSVVHSFTPCSLWGSKAEFLMYTDEGPCLLEWIPGLNLETVIPSRSAPRSRTYSHVTFDPSTGLIVAASCLQSRFANFDEEGIKTWEPDAMNVDYPKSEISTLELITADFTMTQDGFEFLPNEMVTSLSRVTLETVSTESGVKDYIAVGTTVNRGEDLAARGATYIFEIVEVVPDPKESPPRRAFRLRLHCRDDAKGPVSAVTSMNGYLVSSMGQKIFVRAFDLDERLVGIAFLDVGVYVTSIRTLKNLLVIGDALKSVWFAAFQEDPFKLTVLAKDPYQHSLATADILFSDNGQFSLITLDEEGVFRSYDYDPLDPDSWNGQLLMCRTEFHGQIESRTSVTIATRPDRTEMHVPVATILYGGSDGSMYTVSPLEENAAKRLQLLQGQLIRSVQQFAGLNPRANRYVRNDCVPRPLARGILDGSLLGVFEDLSLDKQNEITRQIGSDRTTIMRDWLMSKVMW